MSNDAPKTLRDVAQAALDANRGASGRQLERLAKNKGLSISYTTINHIANGTYKSRPTPRTLDALAALAGIDVARVYRAAGLPLPGAPLRDDLPPDADLLDGNQRRIVVELIRAFAQQNLEIETLRSEQGREDVMGNAEHPAAITGPTTDELDRRRRSQQLQDRAAFTEDEPPGSSPGEGLDPGPTDKD